MTLVLVFPVFWILGWCWHTWVGLATCVGLGAFACGVVGLDYWCFGIVGMVVLGDLGLLAGVFSGDLPYCGYLEG